MSDKPSVFRRTKLDGGSHLSVFGSGSRSVVLGISNGLTYSTLHLTREQLTDHRDRCNVVLAHMDDWRDK